MTDNARTLLIARGVRAFADGFTALLLPAYLTALGFSPLQVGAITTCTLLGSAALTLVVSFLGHRAPARTLLVGACWLMLATGLGFSQARAFWPMAVIGFVGTLNPSGGDVSVFAPLEQSMLAHAGPDNERTSLFARFGLVGALMMAAGSLFVAVVEPTAKLLAVPRLEVMQALFAVYGLLAIVALGLYARLPRLKLQEGPPSAPLGPSKRHVMVLAALFSLDAFGGGFVVQSIMALWLFQRFGMSLPAAGAFFFWCAILSAISQLAAPWVARRIGLVRTMVFTHVPANLCLVLAPFAPNLWSVVALLLVRAALNQMDVPTRTSYVMAVVTPEERTAAAGVTSVPRSLAGGLSPALAGLMLGASAFGWPLVVGGGLKVVYDLLLLRGFSELRPPEEGGRRA